MATTTATNSDTSGTGTTSGSSLQGAQPYIDKAKAFAKQRPWASAALAGVIGVAFLNTLRGK